jgi:hypothetical protein
MRKTLFLLATLTSFPLLADAGSEGLRTESGANQSQSVAFKQKNEIIQKEASGLSIKRREANTLESKLVDRTKSLKAKSLNTKQPRYRAESPLKSTRQNAHAFSIYDAWSYLDYDMDGDGFYSEFTVEFDVDFSDGYADVYAEMYLSLNGGPWIHFNTTDVFTIYGADSNDYYSVSTALNYNFPTGYYDVAIDIYEAGYSGIVATAGPLDFNGLLSLPLEDTDHELNSDHTQIIYVASVIDDDFDRDGFYTTLSLEYDIDTLDSGRMVYAEVDLTNADTFERVTLDTEDFQLGNQTEFLDIYLDSGYRAGWYNVEIRLIDSYTGQVLANAAQEFSALFELPLESTNYDNRIDTPGVAVVEPPRVVVVKESGGGSLGWLVSLGLPLLMLSRRQRQVK